MKFNFDHISYTDLRENSVSNRSNAEHSKSVVEPSDTEKYVNTLLDQSVETSKQGDTISEFYSDLKTGKNLAINQNTADRHGRQ